MTPQQEMNLWSRCNNAIQERVSKAVAERMPGSRDIVYYSAYETGTHSEPLDNLDEVVAEGEFTVTYDGGWGDCSYESEETVTNPTWLDLAVLANEAILTSGDEHHVFLEGCTVSGNRIELYFGS